MARRELKQQTDDHSQPPFTLEDARSRVAEWDAQWQDFKEEAAIESHYANVPASKLLDMYERGKNERGRKLSQLEAEALLCALHKAFGAIPTGKSVQHERVEDPPQKEIPPNDTMLSAADVCRLIGVSLSTLKRMVASGIFPKPMRPTERRIAWPASDVRAFVDGMSERRDKSRR